VVHDERGDIISSWLLQLVLIMAIIGFLGYEVLSMAATGLALDGDADQVANAAADAYQSDQRLSDAEEAAAAEAAERGIALVAVEVEDDVVIVTVRGSADTLVAHRIGTLDRFTHPAATRREKWRP
jgi:preprotein translocase subunit SecD